MNRRTFFKSLLGAAGGITAALTSKGKAEPELDEDELLNCLREMEEQNPPRDYIWVTNSPCDNCAKTPPCHVFDCPIHNECIKIEIE